jgi:hypothetical protein
MYMGDVINTRFDSELDAAAGVGQRATDRKDSISNGTDVALIDAAEVISQSI